MGADKSAENTPNDPKIFGPIVCPSPKVDFRKKALTLCLSVFRGHDYLSNKS